MTDVQGDSMGGLDACVTDAKVQIGFNYYIDCN